MDGKITGFSPPDKFYFDLQRFDLVTERQLDQPGETIVAKVASTEQAQVNVASDEVVEPVTLSETKGDDAVFSCVKDGTTYYGTAADFTTANLAGATTITILNAFSIDNGVEISSSCNFVGAAKTATKLTYTGSDTAIKFTGGNSTKTQYGTIECTNASATAVEVASGATLN